MDNKKNGYGYYLIASAIIWGLVIIGCSLTLKGTSGYDDIQQILYGGMLAHFALFLFLIITVKNIKNDKK